MKVNVDACACACAYADMLLFLADVEGVVVVVCIGRLVGGIAVGGQMQGIEDSGVRYRGCFVVVR